MSGLARWVDDLPKGTVALTCPRCRVDYTLDELDEYQLLCRKCGQSGLIPRQVPRLADRFPGELATDWTPIPNALLERREALGLHPHELLVIWVLESHRRLAGDEVFPSRDRLVALTGLSRASVTRAISTLVHRGLLARWQPRYQDSGRAAPVRYQLDALWEAIEEDLRSEPATHTEPRDEPAPTSAATQPEPRPATHRESPPATHREPRPRLTESRKEEDAAQEADAQRKKKPVGIAAPTRADDQTDNFSGRNQPHLKLVAASAILAGAVA